MGKYIIINNTEKLNSILSKENLEGITINITFDLKKVYTQSEICAALRVLCDAQQVILCYPLDIQNIKILYPKVKYIDGWHCVADDTIMTVINVISDYADVDAICKTLEVSPWITSLTLSGVGLSDDMAQYLSSLLIQFHFLRDICLSRNNIKDDGAKAISNFLKLFKVKNTALQSEEEKKVLNKLDLSNNNIGSKGGEAIAQLLIEDCFLHELDISNNMLDMSIIYFIQSTHAGHGLKKLDISNSNNNNADSCKITVDCNTMSKFFDALAGNTLSTVSDSATVHAADNTFNTNQWRYPEETVVQQHSNNPCHQEGSKTLSYHAPYSPLINRGYNAEEIPQELLSISEPFFTAGTQDDSSNDLQTGKEPPNNHCCSNWSQRNTENSQVLLIPANRSSTKNTYKDYNNADKEEFEEFLDAIKKLLEENGLDALVVDKILQNLCSANSSCQQSITEKPIFAMLKQDDDEKLLGTTLHCAEYTETEKFVEYLDSSSCGNETNAEINSYTMADCSLLMAGVTEPVSG